MTYLLTVVPFTSYAHQAVLNKKNLFSISDNNHSSGLFLAIAANGASLFDKR
ncbi:MAG: hypothetical protein ACKO2V_14330 [Snowella sp.]